MIMLLVRPACTLDMSYLSPVGFLDERNLPLDDIARQALAERILREPPQLGYLTISNALQWRLQYSRVITLASGETPTQGVEDLL